MTPILIKEKEEIVEDKQMRPFGFSGKRNSAPTLHTTNESEEKITLPNQEQCLSQKGTTLARKSEGVSTIAGTKEITNRATLSKMRKEEFKLERDKLLESVRSKDILADSTFKHKSQSLQELFKKFNQDQPTCPSPLGRHG